MCGCRQHFASEAPCTCFCASHRPAEAKTQADYKPGTVATLLVDGCEVAGLAAESGWMYADSAGAGHLTFEQVTDVRPLVVLDLAEIDEDAATTWPQVIRYLRLTGTLLTVSIADQIEQQTKPPKPETKDAHDGCHDKGWTEVDGVRYCNNCGFSEGSRFIKAGGAR